MVKATPLPLYFRNQTDKPDRFISRSQASSRRVPEIKPRPFADVLELYLSMLAFEILESVVKQITLEAER